jgi:hypothetical protein
MRQITLSYPDVLDRRFDDLVKAYNYKPDLESRVMDLGAAAGDRGWLKREEFLNIAKWKSARPTPHYEKNSNEAVIKVSKLAFSATHDLEKILLLTDLDGVRVRTATAILHLCFPKQFPLLDIWSVAAMGISRDKAEKWGELDWLRVWPDYAKNCRAYALNSGHDLRSIDRALWAYGEQAGSKRTRKTVTSNEI